MREREFISKTEASELAQCERRSIYNRIDRGVIATDPATGKIPMEEFNRAFPWVREERLKNLVASLPLGNVALLLVDALGRQHCLQIFNLIDETPGENGGEDVR